MFHRLVISFLWFSWVHWLVNKHRLTQDSEDEVLLPSKPFKCSFLSVPFFISSLTTFQQLCFGSHKYYDGLNVSNHEGAEIQEVLLPQTQQHDPSSSVVGKTESFPFLVTQMDLFSWWGWQFMETGLMVCHGLSVRKASSKRIQWTSSNIK